MLSPIHGPEPSIESQIEDLRNLISHNLTILDRHVTELESCIVKIPSSTNLLRLVKELRLIEKPPQHEKPTNPNFTNIIELSNALCQQVGTELGNELREGIHECIKAFK